MICRTMPHQRISYILCATGAGRLRLSRYGDQQSSSWDYVFIENDKIVGICLLSNPVLDDPLVMMV